MKHSQKSEPQSDKPMKARNKKITSITEDFLSEVSSWNLEESFGDWEDQLESVSSWNLEEPSWNLEEPSWNLEEPSWNLEESPALLDN